MNASAFRVWGFAAGALIVGIFAGGQLAPGFDHDRHPSTIKVVRTGMGMLVLAPEPGDTITWGNINENDGHTDQMTATFESPDSPCEPNHTASECVIKKDVKKKLYLYNCEACQDPGIMPGSGTAIKGFLPPSGNHALLGSDTWRPVDISCVNNAIVATPTPAVFSPTHALQWESDTRDFTVTINDTSICKGGAFTTTNLTPWKVCHVNSTTLPAGAKYHLAVPRCGDGVADLPLSLSRVRLDK